MLDEIMKNVAKRIEKERFMQTTVIQLVAAHVQKHGLPKSTDPELMQDIALSAFKLATEMQKLVIEDGK